jgi:hypothetical protein
MAKNRKTESIESRISRTSFNDHQPYTQVIHTAPARILKEKYLTKKGKKLMALATTKEEKAVIRKKYEKNRYINNPDSKVFRNPDGSARKIKHS